MGNREAVLKTIDSTIEFIKKEKMLEGTNKVYVATSGGADSMALLNFFASNQIELGLEAVGAVHVNHGIRGETADRDAKFVQDFCESDGIEFVLFDASRDGTVVPENASEEWARQLRYGYIDKLIEPGVKIATAHTASDQAETFLFRVARGGSGLKGLRCIPPKRGAYIRPFLGLTRSEIEALVEYYGCNNITDETNLGDVYSRNKIRHNVIPELKKISPTVDVNIGKVCDRISKAYAYIHREAENRLSESTITGKRADRVYPVSLFNGVDEIILDEMLSIILEKAGNCEENYIEIIKGYLNKALTLGAATSFEESFVVLQLGGNWELTVTNKYLTLHYTNTQPLADVVEGVNDFGDFGYAVEIKEMNYEEFQADCKSKFQLCNYADASKIELNSLIIRKKVNGDEFKPACKMGGKVVKFLRGFPIAERGDIPLIEDAATHTLIWVWGQGFTDGYTPTTSTKKIYKVVSKEI